ncbi:tyrosyl-tRNA synthetase [Frankia casuarinae]|jgi:tyrosyl-tRNA synthetase|uniref:Tyrosine--tRNA ligase n=1 Tax=Frankia casuarinae (strain DSM 45818 / CECT 9043 / HFP020203 / CcI3) TaxID=106370 RepID=Q2J5Z6_FRACC|nr:MULTISPECIES: tyrosine--tRNA ligase [Frankia]ABD13296.1 tyrosyl-tRNA synthetase [Frankia casuarinae]ETA03832.1 tyrosyl-tRNA synthetase [Frankia sp. CcI6]EYT93817.1 tyrosyl-tRNA synthetase [Frankia casuarinae]KDA44461.1 tyrosyl-tRNA synthetase [Frankia sp. BMG5.23]KFB04410.1 tyrosyl-tRNA synthetase [Frankia sp. Allo2]
MTHALLDELSWRGLLHDSTDPAELREHLDSGRRRCYIGFDPTAPSLTIGNLLPMTLLIRAARAGIGAVTLFGGGTGLIGDPSGKSVERSLLTAQEVRTNMLGQQEIMESVFARALDSGQLPQFVDNADWLDGLGMIEFLRDVGKHFPVTEMVRRDSVRRRLDDPDVGLTYTEFSYSLLQAYDFRRLCEDHGVTLQMGASDQWGNIVAGIDYVRRVLRTQVHGLTCPLLLRSDGTKFGKSEKGAVWLSADRTSPYTLYQFVINLSDDEARRFALFFSLIDREPLERLFAEHAEAPGKRALQRHLAREITALVHGQAAVDAAEAASAALFSGDVKAIGADLLSDVFADVPTVEEPAARLEDDGWPVVDLLIATGLASSKRDAREHLGNHAVLVNGERVGVEATVGTKDLLHGSVILVRRGRREWRVARFT